VDSLTILGQSVTADSELPRVRYSAVGREGREEEGGFAQKEQFLSYL
jgi:hypothetical protein